jgi:hypothetical protein
MRSINLSRLWFINGGAKVVVIGRSPQSIDGAQKALGGISAAR